MSETAQKPAQRLTVCLVADEGVLERLPTALRYLIVGLIDERVTTALVVPHSIPCDDIATGPATVLRFRPRRWPLNRWLPGAIVPALSQQIDSLRENAPLLIHALSPTVAHLGGALARACDAPLVISDAASGAADLRRTRHEIIQQAAAFVVVSESAAGAVRQLAGENRPVEVIPPGVVAGTSPAAFRDGDHAANLVYAGPITDDRGLDLLLRAAKRLQPSFPDVQLLFAGKGRGEMSLRHLARSLGLTQQVTFTGRLQFLRAVLDAADLFCLSTARGPLREEPIHAMAAGLGIVAAESSLYEGLTDGNNALLFEENDEDQLTEQLRRMLGEPALARRLGSAAQAHARSHYSVGRMVAAHLGLYRRLCDRDRTYSLLHSQAKSE